MEYPDGFPDHLKHDIDAAIADAEVAFLDGEKQSDSITGDFRIELCVQSFIRSIFFAFARQACRAGEEGHWDGERIRREIENFRRNLVHTTYFKKYPRPGDHYAFSTFEKESTIEIENSEEWKDIQKELARVARIRGTQAHPAKPVLRGSIPVRHVLPNQRADAGRKPQRLSSTVTSPAAVKKMEEYLQEQVIGLTELANRAGVTDRTLRTFRKTGTVRRDVFVAIAKAMGMTKEEFMKE